MMLPQHDASGSLFDQAARRYEGVLRRVDLQAIWRYER